MAKRKIKITKATRFDFTIQSFQDEEISIVENPATYRKYDKAGNLIEEIIYGPGGYLSEKYTFVYEDGKMREQMVYLDENTVAEHQFFEYQGDKLIKQITKYQEGEDETLWIYDDNERILSKITYDEGDETEKTSYEYEGDKIRKQTFESDELISEETETLDNQNRVSERIINDLVEEEKTITFYTYTPDGLLETETLKNFEGDIIQSIENEYNDNGKLISVITKTSGSQLKLILKYDDIGNEIYQLETDENGEVNHHVERKFDSEGNILETEVEVFYHGQGMDNHYQIKYEYEFFDENE